MDCGEADEGGSGDLGFGGGGAERSGPLAVGSGLPAGRGDTLGTGGAGMVLIGADAAGCATFGEDEPAGMPFGVGGGGVARIALAGPLDPEALASACPSVPSAALPRTVTVVWPMVR